MASILVRGLDDSVEWQLAEQAERQGRSMEEEARDIPTKGVTRPNIGLALIQVGGADDLPVPERDDVARVGQALT